MLDSSIRALIQGSLQSQYLFPELEAMWRRKLKAVEHPSQYVKMYVAGVWTKTAKGYFKNVEEQVIRRQRKFWSKIIYSVSKTKKYLLKNSTIGNLLLFSQLANIAFYLSRKIRTGGSLYLIVIYFNLKFRNNFKAEFWATFSYGLLLQRKNISVMNVVITIPGLSIRAGSQPKLLIS